MKKEIGPVAIIAAVAVAVVILGVVAYKFFFTDPNYTPNQGEEGYKRYMEQRKASYKNFKASRDVPFNGGK